MTPTPPDLTPTFVAGGRGDLFSLAITPPGGRADFGVLFVPPFAEEMNRSRRMFALQARALAAAGMAALLLDPFGTGDSAGDFAAADIDGWLDDLNRGLAALAERGCARVALVALRFGALLANGLLARAELPVSAVILWQPVISGATYIRQFLRLGAAAALTAGRGRVTVAELEARLADGQAVEVGGYELSPRLYQQILALALPGSEPWRGPMRALLCDIGTGAAGPRPATRELHDCLAAQGAAVETVAVSGAPFWQTPEITTADALIAVTRDALQQQGHGN